MCEEKPKSGLTRKQEAFCDFYLTEAKFNGSEAARLAGYSEKTAGAIAFENLKKPEILAYLRERQRVFGINEFQTLEELRNVAYSDWQHHIQVVFDSQGNVKDAMLMLRDKVKALELLAKIQGLMTEKVELTGKDGGAIQTELILPQIDDDFNGENQEA